MSTTMPDLRNRAHFPSFVELPYDQDVPSNYYRANTRTGVYSPKKHWCFLAEIVEEVPWPIRPMYHVKDADGQKLLVAFHLDNRSIFPYVSTLCQDGHTLAFMYANSHQFGDGQQGIRVEAEETFTVFPHKLDTLLSMSDKIKSKSTACSACGKDSKLRCIRCQARYCDKECQTTDWKQGHKKECPIKCQITRLGNFDWKRFDRFRHFQMLSSGQLM